MAKRKKLFKELESPTPVFFFFRSHVLWSHKCACGGLNEHFVMDLKVRWSWMGSEHHHYAWLLLNHFLSFIETNFAQKQFCWLKTKQIFDSFLSRWIRCLHHRVVRQCYFGVEHWRHCRRSHGLRFPRNDSNAMLFGFGRRRTCASLPRRHPAHSSRSKSQRVESAE